MPFRCKCTLIFEGPQKGWTESLYLEPLTATYSEAVSLTNALGIARARLLGRLCAIKAFRVQVVEDAGGNKVTRRGDTFQRPIFGSAGNNNADSDLCLLADFTDALLTRHKLTYLRGIWDNISENYGAYTPNAQWTSYFDTWRDTVVGSGFGWMSRNQVASSNVTGYVQSSTGFVEITCADAIFAALPLNVPLQVQVQGILSLGGKSTLNGTLLVKPLSGTQIQTVKQIAVLTYVDGGKVTTFAPVMVKTSGIGPEKIVTRETGAPLLESRGRQRDRSRV